MTWLPNAMAMRDNRSVQHDAAHGCGPARRTMERMTVAGDRQTGRGGDYTPDNVAASRAMKPAIAEGTRPGPKRTFDRCRCRFSTARILN